MAFDFKKEFRGQYQPKAEPALIDMPRANYIAVRGQGDPNEEGGAYKQALNALYAVAYTLKMSYKGARQIAGFFEYVVPPLEGFWRQEGSVEGIDYSRKADLRWISALRLPDFVQEADLRWAVSEAERKKKLDCSRAGFLTVDEGLCVQCLHIGAYDDEPATIARMAEFAAAQGYAVDLAGTRLHHEIYLSDPRKSPPEKWRTVIREPVRER